MDEWVWGPGEGWAGARTIPCAAGERQCGPPARPTFPQELVLRHTSAAWRLRGKTEKVNLRIGPSRIVTQEPPCRMKYRRMNYRRMNYRLRFWRLDFRPGIARAHPLDEILRRFHGGDAPLPDP